MAPEALEDPIFKGCTRPAMFAGVPMLPFLLTTGLFILGAFWTFYLVSGYVTVFIVIAYVPIVVTMRSVTKKDDQRLKQLMLRLRMRLRQRAMRALWGAVSYSPIRYKTRK